MSSVMKQPIDRQIKVIHQTERCRIPRFQRLNLMDLLLKKLDHNKPTTEQRILTENQDQLMTCRTEASQSFKSIKFHYSNTFASRTLGKHIAVFHLNINIRSVLICDAKRHKNLPKFRIKTEK